MNSLGLNQGTSGNVSVRNAEGFVITPSGLPYDAYCQEDMVQMGLDGEHESRRKPSSEWRIHRDIYQDIPTAGSILHAHSSVQL